MLKRRTLLALPGAMALTSAAAEAAADPGRLSGQIHPNMETTATDQELVVNLAVKPDDWGPWSPLPGGEEKRPLLAKWCDAVEAMRFQLSVPPACRHGKLGREAIVHLLTKHGEEWLAVEGSRDVRVSTMVVFAAKFKGVPSVPFLAARDRTCHYQAAYVERQGFFSGCRLLEWDEALWKRRSEITNIVVRIPIIPESLDPAVRDKVVAEYLKTPVGRRAFMDSLGKK